MENIETYIEPAVPLDPQPYGMVRMFKYPPIGEQLDMLWHAIDADETLKVQFADFYAAIKQVKDEVPKQG